MDNEQGNFITAEDYKKLKDKMLEHSDLTQEIICNRLKKRDGVFSVGEIIELRGSTFKIITIRSDGLILKLLPRPK